MCRMVLLAILREAEHYYTTHKNASQRWYDFCDWLRELKVLCPKCHKQKTLLTNKECICCSLRRSRKETEIREGKIAKATEIFANNAMTNWTKEELSEWIRKNVEAHIRAMMNDELDRFINANQTKEGFSYATCYPKNNPTTGLPR